MKEIKSIELVLENCDSVVIAKTTIGEILIENIKKNIYRVAGNSLCEVKSCDSFKIEIHKSITNNKTRFSNNAMERLKSINDIIQLCIKYESGENEVILVPWSDDEYNNKFQKCRIGENGNLYIVIDKEREIEDAFDKELMDKEDLIKWEFMQMEDN